MARRSRKPAGRRSSVSKGSRPRPSTRKRPLRTLYKSPRRAVPVAPRPGFFPPSIVLAQAHHQASFERAVERARENIELADRVQELRRYVKGFDAPRYNLREVDRWSASRRERVIDSSKRLRYLISRPHVSVAVPRSAQKRKALARFTQQHVPELKRFIVFTEDPENTQLDYTPDGRVQMRVRSGPHTSYTREFFLWRDFTKRPPVTLKAARRVLKKMLPFMPEGRYAFWSDTQGMTGVPQGRDFIAQKLDDWYHAYESGPEAYLHRGFGRVLNGLVYLGPWKTSRRIESKLSQQRNQYQTETQFKIVSRRKKVNKVAKRIRKEILKRVTK